MFKQVANFILSAGLVLAMLGTPASADQQITLQSALNVNVAAETVTLPLHRGVTADGRTTWYIITESSNKDDAERRGVNPAPKLANALGTRAVQSVTVVNGVVHFAGTVNFSPTRVVVPGPNGFPPAVAIPGAVGDASYSPLITTGNGIVLNASQVANNTGLHDSVVAIDFVSRRVTLKMFAGFYGGHPILYLHVDASDPMLAAIEGSNFAPNLNAAPGIASNDKDRSARSAIIPIVNGPRGVNNPQRQGLQSALLGEGDPLNITQEFPGNGEYSPVWDVHPAVWTDAAIRAGERRRLTDAGEVAGEVENGDIVSGGTGPANQELNGLRAANFISNCPIVIRTR